MITPEQVAQFQRDGFAIVDRVIDDAQVARVRAAMTRVYDGTYSRDRRPPRLRVPISPLGEERSVQWMLNARVLDEDLWRLSTDVSLGRCAAALLQTPSVSIVEDQLLAKPPGVGLPVNVHQDYAYWPFSRSTSLITLWIALCDMTAELGPVQCLRGSHRWGPAPRPKQLIVGSDDGWLEGLAPVRPEGAELSWETAMVKAGGGVFFHALTFHGSRGNISDQWRHAISLHWAAAECTANLAETRHHDFPYFFARLRDGGPLVNKYMPQVYPAS